MFNLSKKPAKQKGITQIIWMVTIVFLIASFVLMIKLVPPYLESMSVKSALKSLAQEPRVDKMSAYKITDLLSRKLNVNSVKSVNAKDLVIERDKGELVFNLKYEVRVHAFGNIDAVLVFDQKVSTE